MNVSYLKTDAIYMHYSYGVDSTQRLVAMALWGGGDESRPSVINSSSPDQSSFLVLPICRMPLMTRQDLW